MLLVHPVDANLLTRCRLRQRERVVYLKSSVCRRDGVAVRILGGVSQESSQPLSEGVRDRVFHTLRLFVHLLPGVAEALQEEGLDQAVAAQQPQGLRTPLLS